MKDQITIHGHDGAFRAYIATPEALPAPAVVVLHEVFGVKDDIRKTCDELSRVSATPSLGITGHTTTPQRRRSPTGEQTSF